MKTISVLAGLLALAGSVWAQPDFESVNPVAGGLWFSVESGEMYAINWAAAGHATKVYYAKGLATFALCEIRSQGLDTAAKAYRIKLADPATATVTHDLRITAGPIGFFLKATQSRNPKQSTEFWVLSDYAEPKTSALAVFKAALSHESFSEMTCGQVLKIQSLAAADGLQLQFPTEVVPASVGSDYSLSFKTKAWGAVKATIAYRGAWYLEVFQPKKDDAIAVYMQN